MRNPEALATSVVLLVKTALAPVLERLAAAEARLIIIGDLRDRVVTVETKAALPLPVVSDPAMSELRDRVLVVETKAAVPLRLDVFDDITARLVALETKAAAPLPPVDLGEVRDRLLTVERIAGRVVDVPVDLLSRLSALEARATDLGALRERVAVVETRAPVPGPAGKDGQHGEAGKDGADGLGFDDVEEVIEDDGRTVITRYRQGDRVKEFVHKTSTELYRGVYVDGKTYDRGDGATWGGSEWHCNETTTTKPGDGSKAWTLKVKRGRDGKDGRDGAPPQVPVVSVGVAR